MTLQKKLWLTITVFLILVSIASYEESRLLYEDGRKAAAKARLESAKGTFLSAVNRWRYELQASSVALLRSPDLADFMDADQKDAARISATKALKKANIELVEGFLFDSTGNFMIGLTSIPAPKDKLNLQTIVKRCLRKKTTCHQLTSLSRGAFLIAAIPIGFDGIVSGYAMLTTKLSASLLEKLEIEGFATGFKLADGAGLTPDPVLALTLSKKDSKGWVLFKENDKQDLHLALYPLEDKKPFIGSSFFFMSLMPVLLILVAGIVLSVLLKRMVEDRVDKMEKYFASLENQDEKNPLSSQPPSFSGMSKALSRLITSWRKHLENATKTRDEALDKLERIQHMAHSDDAQFNVFVKRVNQLTSDSMAVLEECKNNPEDLDLVKKLKHNASSLLNLANVFGIKKLVNAARKLLTTLDRKKLSDDKYFEIIESELFDVLFEMDYYMTIREMSLGRIIEDRSFIMVTQIRYHYLLSKLECLKTKEDLDKKDIEILSKSIKTLDRENLFDYIWRYDKRLEEICLSQKKRIEPIKVLGDLPQVSNKEMKKLNEVVLYTLEFLIEQCLPPLSGEDSLDRVINEIKVHGISKAPVKLEISIDSPLSNPERIFRQAVERGYLMRHQKNEVGTKELLEILLKPMDTKFSCKDLSFAHELTKELGGTLSIRQENQSVFVTFNFQKDFSEDIYQGFPASFKLMLHDKDGFSENFSKMWGEALTPYTGEEKEAFTAICDESYLAEHPEAIKHMEDTHSQVIFIAKGLSRKEDDLFSKFQKPPFVISYIDNKEKIAKEIFYLVKNKVKKEEGKWAS